LVARIQDEHPKARADLKVWKKGAQVIGSFEWDDVGLSVSNEVPDEDDYHDLWRWEVEIDAMEETFNMRVSPVHAIADALREVDNIWAAVDFVNGWPGEWRVHWWKRNAEMA
jgi:hypothetical protein